VGGVRTRLKRRRLSMNNVWYYAQGDKSIGPLTLSELKAILSCVSEAKNVLVWRDSFSSWIRAENVPELAACLIKPPPLSASPPRLPEQTMKAHRERSRWAIGFYVMGFIAFGSQIARDNPSITAAFLIAAGTMGDIRISRGFNRAKARPELSP
jgi:GYF domain 2